MLTPRSIAFVGASEREGTVGHGMLAGVRSAGFNGDIYAVNPRYDTVQGLPCYASLGELPAPVDLAVLGVNSVRIEQQMKDAITHGAKSCVIFDSCYLDDETDRGLLNRLKAMAREADLPVCGGNGMGYLNLDHWLPITLYDAVPNMRRGGHIAFITHSGTVFSEIGLNDPRYTCNLIVSCGQEINGTMADYIDYALEMESTRVIALFMETARDPDAMVQALAKAQARGVPIVAMKVGRTAEAAKFAMTHSGALVGDDSAYQALFERYDTIRVETMDEMANVLTLLSNSRSLAKGGIAAMLDSGGEREMLVDLAAATGTPLAKLSDQTLAALRARLHHSLEATNPLDAWGTADNYEKDFEEYLVTMAGDPDSAMALFCGDMTWSPNVKEGYPKALVHANARITKPVGVLINMPTSGFMEVGLQMTEAGLAVLSGTKSGLQAIRHAMDWRDRKGQEHEADATPADATVVARWRERLGSGTALDEAESFAMLADFGIDTLPCHVVDNEQALRTAAGAMRYPLVLKTAMPGIAHKSDVGGVKLGLANQSDLLAAYQDLCGRLGSRALVVEMAAPGTELVFGMARDPQFGPVILVGIGGIFVEVLKDVRHALPPLGPATAKRLIDRLALRALLDGKRGRAAADMDALAISLSRFSVMCAALGDLVDGIDINPIISGPAGCVAVDALVALRQQN